MLWWVVDSLKKYIYVYIVFFIEMYVFIIVMLVLCWVVFAFFNEGGGLRVD